jgi:hypothetical protein
MASKLAAKSQSMRTSAEQSWRNWFDKYEPIQNLSGVANFVFSSDDQEVKNCNPDCLWVIWSAWLIDKNLYYLIKPSDFIEVDDEDFCGYLVTKNERDESFDGAIAAIDVLCDEICSGDADCFFCAGEQFMLVSFVGPVETVNWDKKGRRPLIRAVSGSSLERQQSSDLVRKAESIKSHIKGGWNSWKLKYKPIETKQGTGDFLFKSNDLDFIRSRPLGTVWRVLHTWPQDGIDCYQEINLYRESDKATGYDVVGYLVTQVEELDGLTGRQVFVGCRVNCEAECDGSATCDFCEGQEDVYISVFK